MFPYIPNTKEDEEFMLKSMGLSSLEEVFKDIPEPLRLRRSLKLNSPISELELKRHMGSMANKNYNTDDLVCFLGAGAYDEYIPSVIRHITSRSEFYTAYTPYQPEISQGTLQVIFEYQSMIAELTGMNTANASMYDGATACAEAALMAVSSTRRKSVVVSKTVHPEVLKVLRTYTRFHSVELVEVDMEDGATDLHKLHAAVNNNTAAIIVQNPNFFGIVEDVAAVSKLAHENKALSIVNVMDATSLGILKSPGELGADIVSGEGQALGNNMNFGGPYLGFLASTEKLMRKLPGRIVGQTEDVDGKRAFVLTLQAREQHIRREKATSNICSNEALNALTASAYLTVLGKQGFREAAVQSMQKAHYAFRELTKAGKFKPLFNRPFFREFAVCSTLENTKVREELLNKGIIGGYELDKEFKNLKNAMLFCVTEKRSKEELDKLVSVLEGIR